MDLVEQASEGGIRTRVAAGVMIFLERVGMLRMVIPDQMDDLLITEAVESVRERLREEVADLDARLARLAVVDYRTGTPVQLQECLAQVTYGLDCRIPRHAREIQRRIALAETSSPAVGAVQQERAPSWVIQENVPLDMVDLEQDARFSQGLRYLSLPADCSGDGGAEEEAGAEVQAGPVVVSTMHAPPTRLGQELSRCTSIRQAVGIARKRLPSLKGMATYDFLVAIGYPVAIPASDAIRFCRFVGLIAVEDKNPAETYMTIAQRAARLTGTPVSHIGYLLSLYSGAVSVEGFKAVCGKKPRCGDCSLSGRCSNYAKAIATAAEAGKRPERGKPINEWAVDERPRERLLAGERLSNSELLAIILRTGSGRLSAVELARELINNFQTLHDLEKASPQDIVQKMKGKGIGEAKAADICAAIELGRRVAQPAADTRLGLRQIGSSRDVFELCRPRYKAAAQEEFLLLVLNTKNRVQKEVPVSLGTLNSSIVHPRDVFRHALREAAAAVIFVHNHPSGDPSPSDEDILLTARLVDAGKLLGIQVLDHVIIGSHEWYSFADHGRLK